MHPDASHLRYMLANGIIASCPPSCVQAKIASASNRPSVFCFSRHDPGLSLRLIAEQHSADFFKYSGPAWGRLWLALPHLPFDAARASWASNKINISDDRRAKAERLVRVRRIPAGHAGANLGAIIRCCQLDDFCHDRGLFCWCDRMYSGESKCLDRDGGVFHVVSVQQPLRFAVPFVRSKLNPQRVNDARTSLTAPIRVVDQHALGLRRYCLMSNDQVHWWGLFCYPLKVSRLTGSPQRQNCHHLGGFHPISLAAVTASSNASRADDLPLTHMRVRVPSRSTHSITCP